MFEGTIQVKLAIILGTRPDIIKMSPGTGSPRREFLHVDDMADACVYLMQNFDAVDVGEFVNIGVGEDITIKELAELISDVVGFEGEIRYDTSKPDGTPQKLLDVSRMAGLGWRAKVGLRDGIEGVYGWYVGENRF